MRLSITGLKDPVFQAALALQRHAERDGQGLFLIEGDIVGKALEDDSVTLKSVFATRDECDRIERQCFAREVPLYEVSAGMISKLVGTGYDTSTKSVAVAPRKALPEWRLTNGTQPKFLLVGECIQDPRNVGVLVRTAEAAGCTAVVLSANSADAWSRQAVRSSTGAILRMPIAVVQDLPHTLRVLKSFRSRIVATSGRAEKMAFDVDMTGRPLAVVVGNEQRGLSDVVLAEATNIVKLPMVPGPDSLNVTVAAGVVLYEAVRQRIPWEAPDIDDLF